MSSHYHAVVWIDHHESKIFRFNSTDVDSVTIHNTHPHQHIHHKANSGDSGEFVKLAREFLVADDRMHSQMQS